MNKKLSEQTTIKSKGGLLQIGEDEIQIFRNKYLKAYDAYIDQKTVVNRNAMYAAWEELRQVKARYREGRKLVLAFVCSKQVR
jgi:hypothetical protein